jgi:hypothetical protein
MYTLVDYSFLANYVAQKTDTTKATNQTNEQRVSNNSHVRSQFA